MIDIADKRPTPPKSIRFNISICTPLNHIKVAAIRHETLFDLSSDRCRQPLASVRQNEAKTNSVGRRRAPTGQPLRGVLDEKAGLRLVPLQP
jgi:hypothetical protein